MSLAIETTQLTKVYGSQEVFRSVNLEVNAGSVHAIIGPNGSGKTTLLKVLSSLVMPTKGTIHVFGEMGMDGAGLRQRVHYVSSDVNLYPFFKVQDILKYASLLYDRWDHERAELLTDAFQLQRKQIVRKLSLGMKMRLRMVIALSTQADILLMDEATNGLDPAAKDQILDLILQEAAQRGVTVVMATHQLSEVERAADTISVLLNGALVTTSRVDDLKEQLHEVYTALPRSVIKRLSQFPGVLEIIDQDESQSIMWTGPRDEIKRLLYSMGANFVDIRSASLDRWFQSLLKKEGVPSAKIVLPQRATL